MGQREGTARRLAWPLLVVGTAYLYFFAGSYYGIYVAEVRLATILLLSIVFGAWLAAALWSKSWRPTSVLVPPIAMALLVMTIATVTSRSPRISLDYLAYTALLLGLYLLLRQILAHAWLRDRMTSLVVLLTATMCAGYLIAVVVHWLTWWGLVGALRVPPLRPAFEGLTYGNPGAVAVLAVMGLIVGAARIGVASTRSQASLGALGLLVATVVLITGSRASWLALGVMTLAVVFLAIVRSDTRANLMRWSRTRSGRRLLVAGALLSAVLAVGVGPKVVERFATGGTEAERASFALVSGRLFAEAPVTGVGPGMWVADRIQATVSPEVDYYIPHAHNIYLQTAAEIGVLGLAVGAFGLACVGVVILRALRDPSPIRQRWAWASCAAITYFGVHQLLDVYVNMPAALFVFAVPIAWLDASETRRIVSVPRRIGRPALAAGLAIIASALIWSAQAERGALAMDRAWIAANGGDWAAALPELTEAEAMDPSMPATLLPLGVAQARAGDTQAALDTFTRLSEVDDLPAAWINRASLEADRGDIASARRSLERGLRLGRQHPQLAIAAGWIYEQLGDTVASDEWYAKALSLEPRLARDAFWSTGDRAARRDGIRSRVLGALSPSGQANFWISAGDIDEARRAMERIEDPESRALMELVTDAWVGEPAARATLATWTQDHPTNLDAITWSARVSAHNGDLDRAQQYRDWANITWGNSGAAGAEVAVARPATADAAQAGLYSIAWGIYTYRRPTPTDQLVPSLPHLYLTQ